MVKQKSGGIIFTTNIYKFSCAITNPDSILNAGTTNNSSESSLLLDLDEAPYALPSLDPLLLIASPTVERPRQL